MTKGQRIRSKREELNIPQTDLAKKVDVSKQTLYKYENDIVTNIPSDKIEALANALGVSPAYICGWNEPDAKEFIELYKNADPGVQQAVVSLLKAAKHDP